jgi:hypothetical protein
LTRSILTLCRREATERGFANLVISFSFMQNAFEMKNIYLKCPSCAPYLIQCKALVHACTRLEAQKLEKDPYFQRQSLPVAVWKPGVIGAYVPIPSIATTSTVLIDIAQRSWFWLDQIYS